MKRLVSVVVSAALAISLAACAAPTQNEAQKVKCPACGYEFTTPMGGS